MIYIHCNRTLPSYNWTPICKYVPCSEVQRRILEARRYEVREGWIKLDNKELHNFYSLPRLITMIQVKKDQMGGTCITNGGKEKCM
jgi:hypothetical protein